MTPGNTYPSSLQFRQLLETEFHELERYTSESLKVLKKNETDWDLKYQHLKDQAGGAAVPLLQFHVSPFLFKHSLFIAVYSFMEYSLKICCGVVAAEQQKHQRRVSGFEKVFQYYSFLTDDLKLDKAQTEEEWKQLNIFRDIRNSIVHYNSFIGKNISSKTYEFLVNDRRIEMDGSNGFRIKDDSLVTEVIQVSAKFLFTLIDQYRRIYVETDSQSE